MGKVLIKVGKVIEVEDQYSEGCADGLRVRAAIDEDYGRKTSASKTYEIPWAFPLLPKVIRTAPQQGELVLVIADATGEFKTGQRYYIGPIISQPQFNTECPADVATSLIESTRETKPLPNILQKGEVLGAFPNNDDVAIVGRGREDIILRYGKNSTSEVDIRAGIRGSVTSDDPYRDGMVGNIIFNGTDPAYIQLKYKQGISTGSDTYANSLVNIVANRVNIMSNLDDTISHSLGNNETLVDEKEMTNIMNSLHQVPHGDKLVRVLELMWKAILNHVHPWPGSPQCGDNANAIIQLQDEFPDFNEILSKYVRIS